jgi:hypothetical protein
MTSLELVAGGVALLACLYLLHALLRAEDI